MQVTLKKEQIRVMEVLSTLVTTLNEHHYGKHQFKAAMLMRGGMLVGGILTNSECWINITQKDVQKLEISDNI